MSEDIYNKPMYCNCYITGLHEFKANGNTLGILSDLCDSCGTQISFERINNHTIIYCRKGCFEKHHTRKYENGFWNHTICYPYECPLTKTKRFKFYTKETVPKKFK
jgi:hypothetical protein